MTDDFDPFRVLGLNVGADEETIKRRYRELVRKHHPDVSSDPDRAHRRFVRIQRAYAELMDPEKRAAWERKAAPWNVAPTEVATEPAGIDFSQLIGDARRLLREGHTRAARRLVARAIEIDPHDAGAYRLLGDIYKAEGDLQTSLYLYQEADLLEAPRAAPRPDAAPAEERPQRKAPAPPPPIGVRYPLLVAGVIATVVAWLAMATTDFTVRPWLFVGWGVAGAFVAAASGVASGAMEPFDDLLSFAGVCERGRPGAPGALALLVLSIVSPIAGLVFFILTSLITESFSKGILKIYLIALLGVLLASRSLDALWLVYAAAPSIGFTAALAGWVAGSFFTPREWWRQ